MAKKKDKTISEKTINIPILTPVDPTKEDETLDLKQVSENMIDNWIDPNKNI